MFYSSTVFLAILAQSANGFNMPKSAQHLTSLRAADPWAPNTATTNTVDLADLKWAKIIYPFTTLNLPSQLAFSFNIRKLKLIVLEISQSIIEIIISS